MKRKFLTWSGSIVFLMTMGSAMGQAQDHKVATLTPPQQIVQSNADGGGDHEQTPVLHHRNPRYQLRYSDVVDLNFPFTPEFNQTVTVQPDGYIALRGVDAIHVEGKTLSEVANLVRSAYAKILHDPAISVELKDFEKPYFLVGGQVGHPGKFDLRGETTATEAMTIAGGLTDSAKHSEVLLFHRVPEGWVQVKKLNMKKMLNDGKLDEDIYMQPGDFLYVPKNTMSKIAKFIPTSSLGLYASPMH